MNKSHLRVELHSNPPRNQTKSSTSCLINLAFSFHRLWPTWFDLCMKINEMVADEQDSTRSNWVIEKLTLRKKIVVQSIESQWKSARKHFKTNMYAPFKTSLKKKKTHIPPKLHHSQKPSLCCWWWFGWCRWCQQCGGWCRSTECRSTLQELTNAVHHRRDRGVPRGLG